MGSYSSQASDYDVALVGAGISGLYLLNRLKSLGFSVICYEKREDIGGTWCCNNYPGARIDTPYYVYQYSDPTLYKDFNFSEKFPCRDEIFKYLKHFEKLYQIETHIMLRTSVTGAKFSAANNTWRVSVENSEGRKSAVTVKFLILCTGSSSQPYIPFLEGLQDFKGEVYHTLTWPKDKQVHIKGKTIAVIGTGASGVGLIQELGKEAGKLVVYQRTPNLALPMKQEILPIPNKKEELYPKMFELRDTTFGGVEYDFNQKSFDEFDDKSLDNLFQTLWKQGGFAFLLKSYRDILTNKAANEAAYGFWRKQVIQRISDPEKRKLLAPEIPPHPFGAKRTSLETNYFEIMSQNNVVLIDVNDSPIEKIMETGIMTKTESLTKVDIIILATGFDAQTGPIRGIDIQNENGEKLKDKWDKDGLTTGLGLGANGFPNMFFMYGPQAPTAFITGPGSAELQGNFIAELFSLMRKKGLGRVEVSKAMEEDWSRTVNDCWSKSLLPEAKSWYHGKNIPGKRNEPLSFTGGVPAYKHELEKCRSNGWSGFLFA